MRNINEHNITDAVIARLEGCDDPRLKEILTSLVTPPARLRARGEADRGRVDAGHRVPHRDRPDVRRQAAGVHPAVGHARRLDADGGAEPRKQRAGAPRRRCSARSMSPSAPRAAAGHRHRGRRAGRAAVRRRAPCAARDGKPVAGAEVDVWEADAERPLRRAAPGARTTRSARARAAAPTPRARLRFRSVLPVAYPIPTDGPVGACWWPRAAATRGARRTSTS